MKKILTALVVLSSCLNASEETKNAQSDSSQQNTAQQTVSQRQEPASTKDNSEDIPQWLMDKYNTESSAYNQTMTYKVQSYVPINDSVAYCILSISDNLVCMTEDLITLVNRKEKRRVEISEGCDSDQSQGSYDWKEFRIHDKRTFEITTYTESVPDSLLDGQGFIKQGLNKDRAELGTIDSVKNWLTINDAGGITSRD